MVKISFRRHAIITSNDCGHFSSDFKLEQIARGTAKLVPRPIEWCSYLANLMA